MKACFPFRVDLRVEGMAGKSPLLANVEQRAELARLAASRDRGEADRAHWLTVERLPKYAPELNDIERVWRDLKAHRLAHSTFADSDALDTATQKAVEEMNDEPKPLSSAERRISA
jgi:hypothetical protein